MESLWRTLFFLTLLFGLWSRAVSDDIGGSFYHDHTFRLSGSPHTVTNEIIVGETATLTVEAGVQLLFPEGVGMTVLGRLIAVGTPSQRIIFDRKRNPPDDQANNVTRDHDIRLLGPTVFEGRVQVKRDGMWGSLCLSSGRWRNSEAVVVCRQLGFEDGRVENKYRFGRGRMAMCDLECRGNENNIYECNHDDIDLPPECDQGRYRNDLGVVCEGMNRRDSVYWKAIDIRTTDESMTSTLQHVDLLHAGGDNPNSERATIISMSVPPRLYNVNIKYSGDAAIRVHDPTTTLEIENCEISENHGAGLIVENPSANVTISSSTFSKNFPFGMHAFGGHTGTNLQITDSTFEQNSGAGLMLSDVVMNVDIRQSNFRTNSHYGVSVHSTTNVNVVTDSCHFDDNGLDGFHARYREMSGNPSHTVLRNCGASGNIGSGFDLEVEYQLEDSVISPSITDQIILDNVEFASNENGSVRVTVDNSDEGRFPNIQLKGGVSRDNMATIVEVGGTHAEVSIEGSEFNSNQCGSKSVIYVDGYDKAVRITRNRFVRNVCRRLALFNTTSAFSDIHSVSVERNIFESNMFDPESLALVSEPLNEYCTVEVVGWGGEHSITQNSFLNDPNGLELCSSNNSRPLDISQIRAENNWWGTTNMGSIKEKIFDSNDWSSGSEVKFVPYLSSPSGSPVSTVSTETMTASALGGRLNGTLRLTISDSPVTLTRDITILPGSVLSVDAGVEIRVQERLGILNLGHLQLNGLPLSPIIFNATRKTVPSRVLPIRLTGGSSSWEGRLEVMFSGQWVPVCYDSYIEFATIACRQLGFGLYRTASYDYDTSQPNSLTIRCDGSENSINECSLYQTTVCRRNGWRLKLSCHPTPGWGGIVSLSDQPFDPQNINLYNVGYRHLHQASGLLIHGSHASNVMNNVAMEEFVGSPSGIEYLDLQPSQRISLQNITLKNANTRDGFGIRINSLRSMSLWELESNVAKRVVSLETMCGGPTSLLLQEGQARWIVNGVRKRVTLRCRKTVKAPDGYAIKVTVTETEFSSPPSKNSLSIYESGTTEIVSLNSYNEISQSEDQGVFTSNSSVVMILLQASTSQDAFFLAKFDVVRIDHHSNTPEHPTSFTVTELTARGFEYGMHVSSDMVNVEIDKSTLSHCYKGLYVDVPGTSECHVFVESTVVDDNSEEGIYVSSLLGSVTLSNVSVFYNSDHGIYISDITGKVNMSDVQSHSNNDDGIQLRDIGGSTLLTDVMSSGNGANDAGIHIYHSNGQQGMYSMVNVTCQDNDGKGMSINVNSEAEVEIRSSLVQGNDGGIFANTQSFSHLVLHSSEIRNNKRFALQVEGKLSYDIVNNTISDNSCPYQPVVSFRGETKSASFSNNFVVGNNARETLSLLFEDFPYEDNASTILIAGNVFHDNMYDSSQTDGNFLYTQNPDQLSCSIEIGGYKHNYRLTNNMLNNPNMDYTMCSRISTTFPDDTIDARYNWWGTAVETEIRNKIFDFDDWNDRAPVDYFPYLTGPDPLSPLSSSQDVTMTKEDFGGRLTHQLQLNKNGGPYIIKADLTIQQNASLTIEPGSTIKVYPCVGLLNFGSLVAQGTKSDPIVFELADEPVYQPQVRLVGGRYPWEGRVEVFYNGAWGTVCGRSYWHTAEANVVCRELGYGPSTLYNTRDFGEGSGPVWIGYYDSRADCDGDEMSIFNCLRDTPGNVDTSCTHARDVGIRCKSSPFVSPRPRCIVKKWGGIRVSKTNTIALSHLMLVNSGNLHRQCSSAISIQATHEATNISDIEISDCEGNGIEVKGDRTDMRVENLNISNCEGHSGVSLAGRRSSVITASGIRITDSAFTSASFELTPHTRSIAECLQTPRSIIKLCTEWTDLHLDDDMCFMETGRSISTCNRHLYAGGGVTIELIISSVQLESSSALRVYSDTRQWYQIGQVTRFDNGKKYIRFVSQTLMSLRYWSYHDGTHIFGEIKIYNGTASDKSKYIIENNMVDNTTGTVVNVTATAGGIIDVQRNAFLRTQPHGDDNEAALFSGILDGGLLSIRNNYMANNMVQGLSLDLTSQKDGNITVIDNHFYRNTANSTIKMTGDSYSTTQKTIVLDRNVFSSNDVGVTESIVTLDNVDGQLGNNVFFNNSAHHVVVWEGRSRSNSRQICENNLFYDNIGLTPGEKYTIVVSGRDVQLHGNVFTNPANDAELATSDRTMHYPINAIFNWWGFNSSSDISSRIRDRNDNGNWAEVHYEPWIQEQRADGPCGLGWTHDNVSSACYRYMGGSQSWDSAIQSCKAQHSILARGLPSLERDFIDNLLTAREVHFAPGVPVWINRQVNLGNGTASCEVYNRDSSEPVQAASCNSFFPYICKRPIVNDCPNFCSHHGLCDGRTCICGRGWEGEDCSTFTCEDRNDCGEFGSCVGPNICKCRNGWQGRACTVSYCNRFTTCKSCTNAVGCGWCDERQSCEPGLYKGPDVLPCGPWFYHSCFTVGARAGCSSQIEVIDCQQYQCNTSLSTTTVESCLMCQDIEGCFKDLDENHCKVWNEDQCSKGFVHPLYNDTTRIEKILIGHNVQYVPMEGNILYRCPVRFSSWGATMFVNEGDLAIQIGQVLSSPQANGVLHKVEQVLKTDSFTVMVAHPATLEDMLDYSDFSQEVQLEMAVDMKRNEGAPELSVVERVLNGNGTLHGSTVRVIKEDMSVYKCIGARAINEGDGSYHLLMKDIPDHLSVGDVIVSNHSNGILEQVTQQTTSPLGVFIQTRLQDCFTSFNFREELETTDGGHLRAPLSCSGGPDGTHGALIVDSAGKDVHLQNGDVVVGRRSGRLLAKVLRITSLSGYVLVEVEPILSMSKMHLKRRRRDDVNVSTDRVPISLAIDDHLWDANHLYSLQLSTTAELSTGLKLSVAVSKSEFRVPTLKKAESFFTGGRLEIGLQGTLDVFERTQTRGDFHKELLPIYGSLCADGTVCIPVKIWADIFASYEIFAEGPGSIEMSSEVLKPDIDGGGSWQPQDGSQWFKFEQNYESNSANIAIMSYSGTATESDHLVSLELKVKTTFSIEFPTSGESEEDAWLIPSLEQALDLIGQEDAFGYSITTSIQAQALLQVSAQSCSIECPYSDRPQYVSTTSSLDYLKGAFDVKVGNGEYHQEQLWRREGWMDHDRDCTTQQSSIDTCRDKCPCPGGTTGMRHPSNESFCMCPCNCGNGNISFSHPDVAGDGCNCNVCPDGRFETVNTQGNLHCPCLCPGNITSDMTNDGRCNCSCTCPDGSREVMLSDGSCPCKCTCQDCHESVLGPQGCICPDSCPDCENDEEPEWQDCTCRCPQKTECGIPPTCVVGRMGPDCRQPDCRPCQGCSGNGRCTTSADSCQSSCVCWSQWFGDCCELRRPRPFGGDPHLQTLDGKPFDYHGIGEFWDCKSASNDFGLQTRMYAHKGASLIGGVAVKAGHSVFTMMTLTNAGVKDIPDIRIDGEMCQLSVGVKYLLNNGTIHLLAQQPTSSSMEPGAVIIISVTFQSGATVSFDVRYSPKMSRQFVNILFSPTAAFKGKTEGLCGLMDDDDANDFTGPDGSVYGDPFEFAESWRISKTHHGSGLMGSWSWNSSNFHPDDVMDPAYSDPTHRPFAGIDGLTQEQKEVAEEMCIALGLNGNLLNECIFDVAITNDTTFTEQEIFKGCLNQCSGRGRCVNGRCDCITGWSGEDCNLGNCTDCSEEHGTCELGFCRCEPGWEGADCNQQATCYAVRNCTSTSHGICVETNVCRCKPGYIGDDCSKIPTCGNVANCSDHGVCVDYDACLCDEQWAGDKCDQFSCASLDYCSGRGRCVDIDVCYCDRGWAGSSCATPDCPSVNQCSHHGDCIAPNTCQCYSGYQGFNCSQVQGCPELENCSGNGICVVNAKWQSECRCFSGYSGARCDDPDCTKQKACSSHGICLEPDLCECDSGYKGFDCSNFSCEALHYCSGHGTCVQFDTCSCDPGWSGRFCNIANCSRKGDCSSQGTCVAPNTCECFPGYENEDCSSETLPNEHPPTFQHDKYYATIHENQPIGTTIVTVCAHDADSGRNGEVRYRLVQGNLKEEFFAVNPILGAVTSQVDFDFESLEQTSFHITIEAFDQGLPSLTGTATITINVTDQNDNRPAIHVPPDTEYNLQTTSPIGFHVTTVQASDADKSDSNSKITYDIATVSPFLSIDPENGRVTVSSALKSGTYLVKMTASDHGSPPKKDEMDLRMIMTTLSTNTAPQCPEDQTLEIFQNITRGSTVAVVNARDYDNGPNGDITYNFRSKTGELGSMFNIDPITGQIYMTTEVPQYNGTFSVVFMTVEAIDSAVESMSCETNVIAVITPPGFSGTVPNFVYPTTTIAETPSFEPETHLNSETTISTSKRTMYTEGIGTGPALDSTTEDETVATDENSVAWYNKPVYIAVICACAAVATTVLVMMIRYVAKMHSRRSSKTVQSLTPQKMEKPRSNPPEKVPLEPARQWRQMFQNRVYDADA